MSLFPMFSIMRPSSITLHVLEASVVPLVMSVADFLSIFVEPAPQSIVLEPILPPAEIILIDGDSVAFPLITWPVRRLSNVEVELCTTYIPVRETITAMTAMTSKILSCFIFYYLFFVIWKYCYGNFGCGYLYF